MATTLIRALINVLKMSPAEFLSYLGGIYAGMNLNPAYPNPPVAMSDFKAAIDIYASAATNALNSGPKEVALRNSLGENLWRMVRQLGRYVEAACKDDLNVFLSSGFKRVSATRVLAPPVSEVIRKIVPGILSGTFLVTPVRDREAYSYELRLAPELAGGVPGPWTTMGITGAREGTTVTNLTPGTTYLFQLRALKKSGYTDWSDSVTRICT